MLVPSLFLFAFTDWINVRKYGLAEISLLTLASIGGIFGQLFSGKAYKYGEASKLGPFWNLEILFLFILESVILGYNFTMTDMLGAAFIIGAIVLTIMFSR